MVIVYLHTKLLFSQVMIHAFFLQKSLEFAEQHALKEQTKKPPKLRFIACA